MVGIAKSRTLLVQTQNPEHAAIIAAGEQAMAEVKGRQLITSHRSQAKTKARRKRGQKLSGGWMHSPGTWFPFKAGYDDLAAIAKPEYFVDDKLMRIHAGGYEGDQRLYIWPAHPTDSDAIEIKRNKDRLYMNISGVLGDLGLLVDLGKKNRYDLHPADEDSPAKPAMMIHMDKVLEQKPLPKKKGQGQAQKQQQQQSGSAPAKAEAEPAPEKKAP